MRGCQRCWSHQVHISQSVCISLTVRRLIIASRLISALSLWFKGTTFDGFSFTKPCRSTQRKKSLLWPQSKENGASSIFSNNFIRDVDTKTNFHPGIVHKKILWPQSHCLLNQTVKVKVGRLIVWSSTSPWQGEMRRWQGGQLLCTKVKLAGVDSTLWKGNTEQILRSGSLCKGELSHWWSTGFTWIFHATLVVIKILGVIEAIEAKGTKSGKDKKRTWSHNRKENHRVEWADI